MAHIKNLTPENVEKLRGVFEEMKQINPSLSWQFYNQSESEKGESDRLDIKSRLVAMEEKMDALNRKIDLIFGNYVLINGRFNKIK